MPFWSANGLSRPDVHLAVVTETRFRLLTSFMYSDHKGRFHHIPKHPPAEHPPVYTDENSTDLATVPPLMWGMLASYGRQTLPAIMHDHMVVKARRLPGPRGFTARAEADALFREALADEGVEWFRRWLFWAGVAIGRYASHWKPGLVILAVQLLAAWAFLTGSALGALTQVLPPVATGPLAGGAAVVLAMSALWRQDWPLPVIGILAGPLVLASLVTTFGFAFLLRLPDMALWFARVVARPFGRPRPGPFPFPRPTRVDLMRK